MEKQPPGFYCTRFPNSLIKYLLSQHLANNLLTFTWVFLWAWAPELCKSSSHYHRLTKINATKRKIKTSHIFKTFLVLLFKFQIISFEGDPLPFFAPFLAVSSFKGWGLLVSLHDADSAAMKLVLNQFKGHVTFGCANILYIQQSPCSTNWSWSTQARE